MTRVRLRGANASRAARAQRRVRLGPRPGRLRGEEAIEIVRLAPTPTRDPRPDRARPAGDRAGPRRGAARRAVARGPGAAAPGGRVRREAAEPVETAPKPSSRRRPTRRRPSRRSRCRRAAADRDRARAARGAPGPRSARRPSLRRRQRRPMRLRRPMAEPDAVGRGRAVVAAHRFRSPRQHRSASGAASVSGERGARAAFVLLPTARRGSRLGPRAWRRGHAAGRGPTWRASRRWRLVHGRAGDVGRRGHGAGLVAAARRRRRHRWAGRVGLHRAALLLIGA